MTDQPTPLYRPDLDRMYDDERQMFDGLVKYGRLVPVEPCEHGYLDEHQWYDTLCPGAGIGGDDG